MHLDKQYVVYLNASKVNSFTSMNRCQRSSANLSLNFCEHYICNKNVVMWNVLVSSFEKKELFEIKNNQLERDIENGKERGASVGIELDVKVRECEVEE